ncbi:hypothetical protein [Bowmanella yangjiangensis]|uniref:Uncharacterized protein n=1 Tax=Bowmanella yangjiangensis TaxID=2811230 RepID=A0ABS3CZV9_9ALTE|nr:hypothetical protein [Bowmanella yangjiangensis]MBN7822089.1 hypothetical protein [Bowmanella yangjiangensis]
MKFPQLTRMAEGLLVLSVSIILLTIWVGYLAADHFSITVQVSAHISLIFAATLLKIAYVLRCIGRHAQKLEV